MEPARDTIDISARSHPPRLRHLSVDRGPADTLRVRVEVALGDRIGSGEARGTGREPAELRVTAEATVRAVADALGDTVRLHLLGIKPVRVFDASVTVVALSSGLDPTSGPDATARRVGAVAVRRSLAESAALATLDALRPADDADGAPLAVLAGRGAATAPHAPDSSPASRNGGVGRNGGPRPKLRALPGSRANGA